MYSEKVASKEKKKVTIRNQAAVSFFSLPLVWLYWLLLYVARLNAKYQLYRSLFQLTLGPHKKHTKVFEFPQNSLEARENASDSPPPPQRAIRGTYTALRTCVYVCVFFFVPGKRRAIASRKLSFVLGLIAD